MDDMKSEKRGKLPRMEQRDDCLEVGPGSINDLPDVLLVDIISILPLKQAVQTSILSRRWKHLWKSIHNVRIHDNEVWMPPEYWERAACAMETFLLHHQDPKIRRFDLRFPIHEGNAQRVDSWIQFALSHGVEEFLVDCRSYGVNMIPSCVFQSQWLIDLRLIACKVQLQLPSSVCLPLLKTLVLGLRLPFAEIGFIISKCPSLENLSILGWGVSGERLVISVRSLYFRSLTVSNCGPIVIDAPTMQSLELRNKLLYAKDCMLGNLSSLSRLHLHDCTSTQIGRVDGLMKMLGELYHVRYVKLSESWIEALSMITNPTPMMAMCLELVVSLTSTAVLRRIITVLSFFPGVETLILVFKGTERPLTMQKCWKSLKHSLSKALQKIKTFVMHDFVYSGHENIIYFGNKVWLRDLLWRCVVKIELVSIVLEKSTCLEKVVITLNRKQNNKREQKHLLILKLTEMLQSFNRASLAAKIFVC